MARKRIERNISFDDVRKKYYVNLDFGLDPETGKQIKKTQTFDRVTQARAALRKHEAARDAGQTVLPKETTVTQWLTIWMNDVIKLSRATTTVYAFRLSSQVQHFAGKNLKGCFPAEAFARTMI